MTRVRSYLLPLAILLCALGVVVLDRLASLDPPAYTERGIAAFESGNWVEAIDLFAQAQNHCETDITARRMLGMSYHNYRWNDEALRQYDDTWRLFSQNAGIAMRNAGRIRRERGETDVALECFARALAVDPENGGIWVDIAETHWSVGRPGEALRAIDRALKLAPGNQAWLQMRATYQRAIPPAPGVGP